MSEKLCVNGHVMGDSEELCSRCGSLIAEKTPAEPEAPVVEVSETPEPEVVEQGGDTPAEEVGTEETPNEVVESTDQEPNELATNEE